MKDLKEKIKELDVHKVLIQHPNMFEKILGIKIDKDSIQHHYQLSERGDHIDFVFKDTSGLTYLVEVKLGVPPINVIPQLYEHEYKKFIEINSDLDQNKIIPVIVTDNESTTDQDFNILSRLNIRLCTYDINEIEDILKKMPPVEPHVPFELPKSEELENFFKKFEILEKNFGDINYLLAGFRGEKEWWEGYYDFCTFWLWKNGKFPDYDHKKIFKLLIEDKKEDCIWFTFLTSIADSTKVSKYIIFENKWKWSQVLSARKNKTEWSRFEDCLSKSRKWCIIALLDPNKRKQVVKDYLEKVGDNQERYFLNLISITNNPFDAYNEVYKSMLTIKNIGNVVAAEFSTYLSQWRILPIIPSENVRVNVFTKKALDSHGIKKDSESYQDVLLRIAKKYNVAPIVIERAMHKLGRREEK